MTRSQKQLLILGVLVVVMVAVYMRAFRQSTPEPTSDQAKVAEEPTVPRAQVATLTVAEPSQQREAQRQHALRLAWRRDPFSRGAALGEISGLALTGILWDPTAPIAIINGKNVCVGEEIDGYQVTAISADRVSLTDGTQTFQLSINP